MRARHGHEHWWTGETPFEVCVGAILTQNANWTNEERAIANLKAANVLAPQPLFELPETELAKLIRPAGCFNVKATRKGETAAVVLARAGRRARWLMRNFFK